MRNIDPLQLILEQEERERRTLLAAMALRAHRDLEKQPPFWDDAIQFSRKKLSKFLVKNSVAMGIIALYEHEFVQPLYGSARNAFQFLVNCWTSNSREFHVLQKYGFLETKEAETITRTLIWFHTYAGFAGRSYKDGYVLEEMERCADVYAETALEVIGMIKSLPPWSPLPKDALDFFLMVTEAESIYFAYDQILDAFYSEGFHKEGPCNK